MPAFLPGRTDAFPEPTMIASVIRFVLQNLPALLFAIALVTAAARRGHGSTAERFLSWILLLPIGVTGLWAGALPPARGRAVILGSMALVP